MKNLTKISSFLYVGLIALTSVFTFASCDKDDDNTPKLKFNSAKVEFATGKTATVTVSGGAAPYTVLSSDAKIATVTVNQSTITITGVKNGSAKITVTDKNKISGQIAVLVKNMLDFDKNAVTVGVGKEEVVTIKGGAAPYTATSKDSKIAIASVKDGTVTVKGVKAGTTTIEVTDKDKVSGTISVTIK